MYSAEEILKQLDNCCRDYGFPMLDNGYVYPAGTHLKAYRDDNRWVIIIEHIGFNYRGGGHNGITNCLHVFGNCLDYAPGMQNKNFLYLTDDADDCNTFDHEELFYLNPDCKIFLMRGEATPLILDRAKYKETGISLEDNERINAFEFLRLLDSRYHSKLVATEKEIRERIPADVPLILSLRDWFHPNLSDELPSQNETFQMVAKVLVVGNVELYKPTQKPNTHWTNWPDGGTL